MDFQKKFPFPNNPDNVVIAQWEKGYKNIELRYNDELVKQFPNASGLIKGIKFNDSTLGNLELKLVERNSTLDLMFDGLHAPTNKTHPLKQIKGHSAIFWLIAIGSLLVGAYEIYSFYDILMKYPSALYIVVAIDCFFFVMYTLGAILMSNGKFLGFWFTFILFSLYTLILMLSLVNTFDFKLIIHLLIRGVFIFLMIKMLPTMVSANRHLKLRKINNYELLDN